MTSELNGFDWDRYEADMAGAQPGRPHPVPAQPDSAGRADDIDPGAIVDGATLLDELLLALTRYLVMPSPEAADAVVLWIAATHAQPAWEHATRLGVTGPAKRCGKSRLLEIVKATAHRVLPAIHASTAALYRSIDSKDPPTVLFDEADAIFGTKRAAESNEELRALINAGHSRGWPILRCVGPNQDVRPFPSFAMAALAGIGDLPDTIADRAVNIRMRRRAPGETIKPFRTHRDTPALHALRSRLNQWLRAHLAELRDAEPDMPVEDRAADTWESLTAVADLAGGDWPERARTAAKVLTADAAQADADTSTSTRLLADLRTVLGTASRLRTTTILERLHAIEDSAWAARSLAAHDLARMLRPFGVRPRDVREDGGPNRKGYHAADLHDVFSRYLTPTDGNARASRDGDHVAVVADGAATAHPTATGLTCDVAAVADVAAPRPDPPDDPDSPPTLEADP